MWGVCILVFGEGLSLIVVISNFSKNVKYSRRVLEYSLRYSPSTRVANYSDSTALYQIVNITITIDTAL